MTLPVHSEPTDKRCPRCKTRKSLDAFSNDAVRKDGLSCWCKVCCSLVARSRVKDPEKAAEASRKAYLKHRDRVLARSVARHRDDKERMSLLSRGRHLRRNYGITIEEYNKMVEGQNGVCAICSEACRTHVNLTVDHSHVTGKVRGLLCFGCNTSIGKLKDSPALLAIAFRYLATHGEALTTEELVELLHLKP